MQNRAGSLSEEIIIGKGTFCDQCGDIATFEIEVTWSMFDFGTWWACMEHGPHVTAGLALRLVDNLPPLTVTIKKLWKAQQEDLSAAPDAPIDGDGGSGRATE